MRELWKFQADDVDELRNEKSAILGYEMGAGKTITAIARDLDIRQQAWASGGNRVYPTLVVAPMSTLVDTWYQEFAAFHGAKWAEENVYVIDQRGQPTHQRRRFVNALEANLHTHFIIHWQALDKLVPDLREAKISFLHIIGDEIQAIKNRKALVSVALKRIPCVWKTALSGTPADNQPADWWSILNWLWPKEYTSYWKWHEYFIDYEKVQNWQTGGSFRKQKGVKPERLAEFHEDIADSYRRHTKRTQCCERHPLGVFPDLPDKLYSTRVVELGAVQRKAYDNMRANMIAWVDQKESEGELTPMIAGSVVSMLCRLQMFALGNMEYVGMKEVKDKDGEIVEKPIYRMVEPSAKLDLAMEIIQGTSDQIVVFSQFKQAINLLQKRMVGAGIQHSLVTGDISAQNRTRAIQDFSAGRSQVFAGTIAAGGTGLNLQSASTTLFLDRAWSPSKNRQAEDRTWRAGQKNTVHIIDIIGRDTVDIGRMQRIEMKWLWVKQVLTHPKWLQEELFGSDLAVEMEPMTKLSVRLD